MLIFNKDLDKEYVIEKRQAVKLKNYNIFAFLPLYSYTLEGLAGLLYYVIIGYTLN
jgi:hypothetical protein